MVEGSAGSRLRERAVWRRHVDQIVEAVADGVVIVDEECRIQHVNTTAERIFGMPKEDLIGRRCDDPAWSLTTHDGTPVAKNELVCYRALETGEISRNVEQCIRRPDGTRVMLLVGASPLRDESGSIVGIANTYTDITNLKRAENELSVSAEYNSSLLRMYARLGQANSYTAILQALLSEIPRTLCYKSAGLLVLDENGTRARLLQARGTIEKAADSIMQLGEEFRDQTGDEQCLILPIGDDPFLKEIVEATHIVVVEDARTDPRTNKKVVEASQNRTIINVPLMLAGKKLGVLNTGTFGDDEGVRPPTERQLEYLAAMANHVAVAMDRVRFLEERRKGEEALRESESRLRDIIGNTNAIIYLKDRDGRFLLANDQFARLFGLKEDEVIGKTGREVFPAADMALELEERERNVRDTGQWFQMDETMRTSAGVRHYSSVTFPLRDASGAIYAVCGVSTDVTETKRAQEELRTKDRAIRQAYVDVIAAVTGNKLILMTPDELKESLGELLTKRRRITHYRSLAQARADVSTAIEGQFPDIPGVRDFIVGVCEGLTNAIKHGGSGQYEVCRCGGTAQVVISDEGPGVDFTTVPKATLEAGFSTQGTLGVGFTIMLEMSDRVLLSTQPGGTTLVLELGGQG